MAISIGDFLKASEPTIIHGDIETSEMVRGRNYNLITKDGIYASGSNGVMRVNKKIVDFGKANVRMDSLGEVEEGVELLIDKIPFKYYVMTLDYFRAIYDKYGTEAGVTFFHKTEDTDMEWVRENAGEGLIEDGDLLVYCPKQRNSPSVHIVEGEEVYEYLRHNALQVVEVHSHHTMGIKWSGVDDNNMKHFMGYTVFNHIHKFESTQTRTYLRGEYVDFDTSIMFELPWDITKALSSSKEVAKDRELRESMLENIQQMASSIESLDEFPEDWMERGKSVRAIPKLPPLRNNRFLNAGNRDTYMYEGEEYPMYISETDEGLGFDTESELSGVWQDIDENSFEEFDYDDEASAESIFRSIDGRYKEY